jgi:hypothetical protein
MGLKHCYTTDKAAGREIPDKGFSGLFATAPIAAGEVIAVFMGKLINGETLAGLPPADQVHILQIDEDLYIEPHESEDAHMLNHSCDPNAWFEGPITVVARREIAAGEEICFDYAMCDGSPYDEFTCLCGSADCRGTVKGSDWSRPELWERYGAHFSPYLLRRIRALA